MMKIKEVLLNDNKGGISVVYKDTIYDFKGSFSWIQIERKLEEILGIKSSIANDVFIYDNIKNYKNICKLFGIKKISKLSKNELIEVIKNHIKKERE